MSTEPIQINRIIRPMRGAGKSFFVQGRDDCFYVAKFSNNPQGTRTLINEWIVGQLLTHLRVSTPPVKILTLEGCPEGGEKLYFTLENKRRMIEGRLHFGSQCPVNPEKKAIYDFLPSRLLPLVVNVTHFATMLVFDKWVGQVDARQSIFVRESGARGESVFRSYFIDHGLSFAGNRWAFEDAPGYGQYMNCAVYSSINLAQHTRQVLSSLDAITETHIYDAAGTVPLEWFSKTDETALAHLLRSLHRRRDRLPLLVDACIRNISLQTESLMG